MLTEEEKKEKAADQEDEQTAATLEVTEKQIPELSPTAKFPARVSEP